MINFWKKVGGKRMKTKAIFLCFLLALFSSCYGKRFIQRMQEYEEGVSNPTTEAELNEAINKYLKRIDDIVIASERVGTWYKMLGTRYLDKKMYKNALECFQKAIEFYPENQNLYYKVGVISSLMAKGALDFEMSGKDMQRKYYDLSIKAYNRAIELDPSYSKAIYALSVLYIFELALPERAVPLLEKEIEGKMKPLDELFLLARSYAMMNNNEKAIEAYRRIIEISGSSEQRKKAQENIDILLLQSN